MRECSEREVGGRRVAGHCGVRGEKNGDAGRAVIEIGSEADELKHFGIAQPIEPDPGRTRSTADGALGNLGGDLVGFGGEQARRDRRIGARGFGFGHYRRRRRLQNRIRILADDLDLPGDFLRVEMRHALDGAGEARHRRGPH